MFTDPLITILGNTFVYQLHKQSNLLPPNIFSSSGFVHILFYKSRMSLIMDNAVCLYWEICRQSSNEKSGEDIWREVSVVADSGDSNTESTQEQEKRYEGIYEIPDTISWPSLVNVHHEKNRGNREHCHMSRKERLSSSPFKVWSVGACVVSDVLVFIIYCINNFRNSY